MGNIIKDNMQISIELTLTPLQADFEEHIIRFIKYGN
jgi:hypothetical protein